MKMQGNTILITGATSGIGRALAERFHTLGNTVIVAGRRQHLLDELTQRHAGMTGLRVDMSDRESIARLARDVASQFPDLNVLINNAGMAKSEDYTASTVSIDSAMAILQTNVASVIQLTAALLPILQSQSNATLMATSSGLAFVPYPPGPSYSGSKAFLHNWLEALRFQLRRTRVEVLELVPPYVQTELGGPQQATDPRAMPLDAFADEVMLILEQGRAEKGEILVQSVKPLRWAEKDGSYESLLKMFGGFQESGNAHE